MLITVRVARNRANDIWSQTVANTNNDKLNRREFLKRSAVTAAAVSTGLGTRSAYGARRKGYGAGKKVIVIGIDGMDPRLSEQMMNAGKLPNFDKLRKLGGFRMLGTSIPPHSPVAWANFITGANPGTHGIFSIIHRDLENPCKIINSISHTTTGLGLPFGKHLLLLRQPKRVLGRQGVPFWNYLDRVGIASAVYLVPSNYPPSRSKYGHHRSLSGMGTPDLLGTISTYQYLTTDGPAETKKANYGIHCRVVFKNETAKAQLFGPQNYFLRSLKRSTINILIHRDMQEKAVAIEIQGQRILLKQGQWSNWVELDFVLDMPAFIPGKQVNGICRIYLQKIKSPFRLYISPIGINPTNPAMPISEPEDFVAEISKDMGQFYTVGFNEEFNSRNNNVFTDEEYATQAEMVLQTRLKLLNYALNHYDDGLLFFYFSSTDLQSHMFWWDSDEEHPIRSRWQAVKYHNHIKELYKRMDDVLAGLLKSYGDKATIIALSDHGFSYLKRYFDVNTWLRSNGYIRPAYCTAMCPSQDNSDIGVDWSATRAYAVHANDLYLNLKGREKHGIVKPEERETLLQELITKLEAVRDVNGSPVIHKVYRSDQVYSGPAMKYAPDLILGFHRGFRAPGFNEQMKISPNVLFDNKNPWSADHCFSAEEIPGVLFANRAIKAKAPSLVDIAPTILAEFDLSKPNTMEGQNIFAS